MKKNLIPLFGVLMTALFMMASIHGWIAAYYSAITGISIRSACTHLTVMLVLYACWRDVRILIGKNEIAAMVNKWLGR